MGDGALLPTPGVIPREGELLRLRGGAVGDPFGDAPLAELLWAAPSPVEYVMSKYSLRVLPSSSFKFFSLLLRRSKGFPNSEKDAEGDRPLYGEYEGVGELSRLLPKTNRLSSPADLPGPLVCSLSANGSGGSRGSTDDALLLLREPESEPGFWSDAVVLSRSGAGASCIRFLPLDSLELA